MSAHVPPADAVVLVSSASVEPVTVRFDVVLRRREGRIVDAAHSIEAAPPLRDTFPPWRSPRAGQARGWAWSCTFLSRSMETWV